MSKKKLLINEVFEQARRESEKTTKSGLASYLHLCFIDNLKFYDISEKTFIRYYEDFVEGNSSRNIESERLNKMSQYVGYEDFTDFSRTFIRNDEKKNLTTVKISVDQDEEIISERLSKININIINEQHFRMPEFVRQNSFGLVGMFILGGFLIGNYYCSTGNKTPYEPLSILSTYSIEKNCMYWNNNEYKLTDCKEGNPVLTVVPKDNVQIKYFKRITRKDTLTVENALGKTWYSKVNGKVEFFTMDGIDPENKKELKRSTEYIIKKYSGKNSDMIPIE
ncbi:hypothetical protein KYG33_14175 [Chryseobacterium sp. D764]|uniref:hypothetical protein n=1 Tax=unclassified Chryseobacterium TaxID=2593645 RepID=UPI0009871621|nr:MULTISPECIES: hypothetical protein [unclassified Chryseobacterium]QXU47939.1 hypothetical protein KYG33_14175 [Chryseobacterium sp. D764]CAD0222359.1 conserved protein of unknown function [Chryseobacterium sp. JV274]